MWRLGALPGLRIRQQPVSSNTAVQSIASLTCLAVELFVLPALAVWLCRLSSYQKSPTGLSRLSAYAWTTHIPWPAILERSTGWCDVCWVAVYISPVAENPSLHKIIFSWTLNNLSVHYLPLFIAPLFIFKPLKNRNPWLIDWLKQQLETNIRTRTAVVVAQQVTLPPIAEPQIDTAKTTTAVIVISMDIIPIYAHMRHNMSTG